jgi:hypothetical protein
MAFSGRFEGKLRPLPAGRPDFAPAGAHCPSDIDAGGNAHLPRARDTGIVITTGWGQLKCIHARPT